MTHEFTLDEVLQGKATRIKNKEYFKTEMYIRPFLDRMSKYTNDFRIQVKAPDQITINENGEIVKDDLTFNRIWIQAILPGEYAFENHQQVVGMVMGLDTRRPVAKFYQGALNMACTNLSVFNPNMLDVQEIQPEQALDYNVIHDIMGRADNVLAKLNHLKNTKFDTSYKNINESLGRWLRNSMYMDFSNKFGTVKFSTQGVIDAYKLLFEDEQSPYFVGQDGETDMFNIHNAFTQVITNDTKDIMNHFEKTLVVNRILGV